VNRKCIRVLIVDDLVQVRESLATVLNLTGKNTMPAIEVIGEAQNGMEAVQQARILHPDVVLMDLEMPILDGYEATRRIKTEQPAVRVIILSIHARPEEQQRALEAGADGFVVKGDSYKLLLDTILAIN
jgi:DNA-binding NarL/FixJ family response regulator